LGAWRSANHGSLGLTGDIPLVILSRLTGNLQLSNAGFLERVLTGLSHSPGSRGIAALAFFPIVYVRRTWIAGAALTHEGSAKALVSSKVWKPFAEFLRLKIVTAQSSTTAWARRCMFLLGSLAGSSKRRDRATLIAYDA